MTISIFLLAKLLENLILSDDETWATVNSDTLKNVIYKVYEL